MSLIEITKQIVGKQYELGSCDCFRVVYEYIGRYVDLPKQWRGLPTDDYAEMFEKDPEYAKWLVEDFLDHNLESIAPKKAFAGDILLLQQGENQPFPAIHAGNQHFVGAEPKRGIAVFPLRMFKTMKAWRCR